jgi:Flp pilus assembly protein TadG
MFGLRERMLTRHHGIAGQALVEFALILPILLTIFGAATDMARVYGAWVTLEGATRDAAEQVASDATITTSGAATTRAQQIVCTETSGLAGFVAPAGNPTACTTPTVAVTWSTPSVGAPGGTTANPIGSATVTVTFPFRTLFAYPLLTHSGAWTISSTQSYSIAQNRP